MTPYRYFKDKDEILAAVRAAAFDRFANALEKAFAQHSTEAPRSRSAAVGRAYVGFALSEPHAYRLMFDLMQPGEDTYPDLVRAATRARATMTDHLSGVLRETTSPERARLIGYVYWAAIHGVLMLHLADKLTPDVDAATLIETTMAAIERGVD
jgi:AcrR family transcriptional regulator